MFTAENGMELLDQLTVVELDLVAGGMMNQYQDGIGPMRPAHQPGELVSMIGYRTFGDVGL